MTNSIVRFSFSFIQRFIRKYYILILVCFFFFKTCSVRSNTARLAAVQVPARLVRHQRSRSQEGDLLHGPHRHAHALRTQEALGQRGQDGHLRRRPGDLHGEARAVRATLSRIRQQNHQLVNQRISPLVYLVYSRF